MIKDRQKEIDLGLKLKAEMEEKEEGLVQKKKKVLEKARQEAQELLEQKKKDAVEVQEKIIANARSEKEEIVAQGKREIEAHRQEMEKKLQSDVIEIAYGMTQKILQGILSKKDQEAIIRSQLDKLVVKNVKK